LESRNLDVIGREPAIGALIAACNTALDQRSPREAIWRVTRLSRQDAADMSGTGRGVAQRQPGQADWRPRKPVAT
jgi:hypothetical protein